MTYLKTASEMRRLANEADLRKVLAIIEKAAETGEFTAYVPASILAADTMDRLQVMGYKVLPTIPGKDCALYPVTFDAKEREVKVDIPF